MMWPSGGFEPATFLISEPYEDQVIIACDMVNEANDFHQFKPVVEQAEQNLSEIDVSVKTVHTDAGYCSEDNLEYLESTDEIEVLISTRKEREMKKTESTSGNTRRPSDRYKSTDRKLKLYRSNLKGHYQDKTEEELPVYLRNR